MKSTKSRPFVKYGLHILGFLLCILPPVICTASYFPIWKESGQAVSGGVLLLLLIAAYPLYKFIKQSLTSPAAYTVWLILFILFSLLSRIAMQMTVISFVGFIGNALGAVCFYFAKRLGGEKE